MGNPWFQFKQFRVSQEKSALRVGTEGVLLGAWCDVTGTKNILDVGTGTGVIALMLAQRSEAQIDAVEIDNEACQDASGNFQSSPWKERISLYSEDFILFSQTITRNFDLIVSNPPFFKNSLRSANHSSSLAKHDVSLTFEQLISGAKKLLSSEGRLGVIIPADACNDFRETARMTGFYLARKTLVIPRAGRLPKRVLLEFSALPCYPVLDELVILLNEHQYSDTFIALTKEFYL
ncbi:MAG TPA: methyltransferase [Prolixibacteraceae bacterium]